mgnify:CR=1 FL=1
MAGLGPVRAGLGVVWVLCGLVGGQGIGLECTLAVLCTAYGSYAM